MWLSTAQHEGHIKEEPFVVVVAVIGVLGYHADSPSGLGSNNPSPTLCSTVLIVCFPRDLGGSNKGTKAY